MNRDAEQNREILNWASEKTWNLSLIQEFYDLADARKFPVPERIGLYTIPTTNTFRYYCRFW